MAFRRQGLGRLVLPVVVLLICVSLLYSLTGGLSRRHSRVTTGASSLLDLDGGNDSPKEASEQYCKDRFGIDYLRTSRNTQAQYCSVDPQRLTTQSQVTCLSTNVDPKSQRTDSFCIAGPAIFDMEKQKFELNCRLKSFTEDERSKGTQPLSRFPAYWYQTGPKYLLDNHFSLNADVPFPKHSGTHVLIKREDANFNLWHSLMEIMSAYWSLLILSQTMDVATGEPLYSYSDHTTVIIADDIADGPYFDLWSLVAPSSTKRLTQPLTHSDVQYSNSAGKIVLPLPGGSNPFWQGDWVDLNCTRSTLLDDFSEKVLSHYDIHPVIRYGTPITITYIDRVTKRRLIDQDYHIAALRKAHPYVKVNIVDYASYKFNEQLKISASSDILVGVHGAGLTHVMFMPSASSIVELMPSGLDYKGFKNMARMRGVGYFQGKLKDKLDKTGAKGNWQDDDVWISEEAFLDIVGKAIEQQQEKKNGR